MASKAWFHKLKRMKQTCEVLRRKANGKITQCAVFPACNILVLF